MLALNVQYRLAVLVEVAEGEEKRNKTNKNQDLTCSIAP